MTVPAVNDGDEQFIAASFEVLAPGIQSAIPRRAPDVVVTPVMLSHCVEVAKTLIPIDPPTLTDAQFNVRTRSEYTIRVTSAVAG